jgi:hypothetical protein
MIFENMSTLMNNLGKVDDLDKLNKYEKEVNDLVLDLIKSKKNIKAVNEEYKKLNDQILNLNFQTLKEIIQQNFDPSLYSEQSYPDLKFYTVSNIYDIKTFTKIFNSNSQNKNKYVLIIEMK